MINLLRSRCHNIVSSNLKKHARSTIKKTSCTFGTQLKSVQSFNFSNVPRSSLDLSDKEHKLIKVNAGQWVFYNACCVYQLILRCLIFIFYSMYILFMWQVRFKMHVFVTTRFCFTSLCWLLISKKQIIKFMEYNHNFPYTLSKLS